MFFRPIWRPPTAALCLALALLAPVHSSLAQRGGRPSLLLGGQAASPPSPAASVAIDPRLPSGALVQQAARPSARGGVACGLRTPVCVHFDERVAAELVAIYVTALEQASLDLVHGLGLPAPLADPGLGPTPGLDLYLSSDAPLDVSVSADPAMIDGARRSAFCRALPSHAEARRQAFGCVGEALLLGVNAATTPFLRRALSEYLWTALGAPTGRDLIAFDALQANPQLGVAGREDTPEAPGAALFFEHVDRRLGAGAPGRLPVALAQLARGDTRPGALRYQDEPDLIDVLRRAFAAPGASFEDFMLGFAVERAFVGTRDDGRHHPELAWLGDAGRVRFDWVLAASSLPRHVAPRRPLEAFGCAYSWLDLDRVTLGKTLAFRAEWEAPSAFRFALVTVDAQGAVLGRLDLPYVQNATSAERTLVDYDGALGVLIVALNLGGIDLAHPFDPDHEPSEPHGFTLYVAEL
jgi:hypothetical protein